MTLAPSRTMLRTSVKSWSTPTFGKKGVGDGSEAEPPRRAGLDGQRDGIAVNGELGSRLRLVETGQHFDQRRLAGTVLPEKAVHLPGQNFELDLIERQRSAKTFRQPSDRQRRASARRRRGARSGHRTPQRAL